MKPNEAKVGDKVNIVGCHSSLVVIAKIITDPDGALVLDGGSYDFYTWDQIEPLTPPTPLGRLRNYFQHYMDSVDATELYAYRFVIEKINEIEASTPPPPKPKPDYSKLRAKIQARLYLKRSVLMAGEKSQLKLVLDWIDQLEAEDA